MTTFLSLVGYTTLGLVMVLAAGAGWLLAGVGGMVLEERDTPGTKHEGHRLLALGVLFICIAVGCAFFLGASL